MITSLFFTALIVWLVMVVIFAIIPNIANR